MESFTFNTDTPLTTLDVDLGGTTLSTLDVDIGSSTTTWDDPIWPPTATLAPTIPVPPEPTSAGDDTSATADLTVTEIVTSITVTETVTTPSDDASATTTSTDGEDNEDDEEGVASSRVHGGVSLGCIFLVAAGTLYMLWLN